MIDLGHGEPLVIVPGIQGRWEWMRPGVEALAEHCRVITFSLGDEPTAKYDGSAQGFDRYVDQVARALDAAGLQRAAICGVSFGGLIAAAFAARHPERVTSLVLASALPPSWKLDKRASFYLRSPRLLRAAVLPVVAAALSRDRRGEAGPLERRVRGACAMRANVTTHPFNARRMAGRALMTADLEWLGPERRSRCRRCSSPASRRWIGWCRRR